MYKKIILAYGGSRESQQALLNCRDLSQWDQAQVHLLSVIPYDVFAMGHETSYFNEQQNKADEIRCLRTLNEGLEHLNKLGIEAKGELLKGNAVDQIVEYAHNIGADLVMLGHKHRDNWLERWWAGAIPKGLIEHAPCSVLVVIIK